MLRVCAEVSALAVAYALLMRLGLHLAVPPANMMPIWPPSGIAAAAVLLFGRRVWPGIWIGAFVGNLGHGVPAWALVFIACGSVVEGLFFGWLADRLVGSKLLTTSVSTVRGFVVATGSSCLLGALIGVGTLLAAGKVLPDQVLVTCAIWSLGDAAGILVVTPVLVLFARRREDVHAVGRRQEQAGFLIALVVSCAAMVLLWAAERPFVAPASVLLVFPMWAAFRLSHRHVSMSGLAIAGTLEFATVSGVGPFASSVREFSTLSLDAWIVVVYTVSWIVAAALVERRESNQALAALNALLEERVSSRTEELADANAALELREQDLRSSHDELDGRVAAGTAALQQAIAEIQDIAYTVGHDMRAPLRGVDGMLRILEEDHGGELSDDARSLIARARRSAKTMGQMVDALLTNMHLIRCELNRETLDVESIARSAWADVMKRTRTSRAELVVKTLPPAFGDRDLIHRLFVELLANAVKFTAGVEKPVVTIDGGDAGGLDGVHWVSDNGVGFDMDHAGKLFGFFQRAHPPDAYEGIGAGLSIVRRIVERHGGMAWAEAEPGMGATVFFTLG